MEQRLQIPNYYLRGKYIVNDPKPEPDPELFCGKTTGGIFNKIYRLLIVDGQLFNKSCKSNSLIDFNLHSQFTTQKILCSS